MQKPTMTVTDVYHAMRQAGIPCSPQRVSDGIAAGFYPFGRVTGIGPTGRRTIVIYTVDFQDWLAEKQPRQATNLQLMQRSS